MKRNTAITLEKKYGKGYMAKLGRKGGQKKVAKGFAMLPPERRAEVQKKAYENGIKAYRERKRENHP